MRQPVSLTIPQPCHQSWAAMTPATAGRHCAACEKTVVDFTLKTDAEILAFLAGAVSGRTCGRFAAGQLERPLQRAVLAAPTRWRAWLAAAVAVWGMREVSSAAAHAQAPAEWRARYWGGPAPTTPPVEAVQAPALPGLLPLEPRTPLATAVQPAAAHRIITMGMVSSQPAVLLPAAAPLVLRGVITDWTSNQTLPGVTVLLTGTTIGTSTRADGTFKLMVPLELAGATGLNITVSSVGYVTQEHQLATAGISQQRFQLQPDTRMLGEVVICRLPPNKLPPAPWHPRRFYNWSKYWLTQPFRRN
ncbi:carboxypeptidase-like regulatory domain-containing protein [Hymenobacter frigidus]|nr:carboxypeptidase-like regulatory domain-containing protein [Hymenobacter frigidus]